MVGRAVVGEGVDGGAGEIATVGAGREALGRCAILFIAFAADVGSLAALAGQLGGIRRLHVVVAAGDGLQVLSVSFFRGHFEAALFAVDAAIGQLFWVECQLILLFLQYTSNRSGSVSFSLE